MRFTFATVVSGAGLLVALRGQPGRRRQASVHRRDLMPANPHTTRPTFIVLSLVLLSSLAHASGRCNPGTVAGGFHCGCPDILAQLGSGQVVCPAGFVPVVYDLANPAACLP